MISLYKKGKTHFIRGIHCCMETFPTRMLKEKLKEGYVTDPKELEAKQKANRTRKAKKDD